MTALVLRTVVAAILWLGCSLWSTAATTPRAARLACDTAVLLHLDASHWLAAWDWGMSTRLVDPAQRQRQRHPNECGPASLRRLLSSELPSAPALPAIETRNDGCTLAELQRAADSTGVGARIVRFGDLRQLTLPAILHLRRHHFVVLEELHPGSARLFDPGHGLLLLPPRSLRHQVSGAGLEIVTLPVRRPPQREAP